MPRVYIAVTDPHWLRCLRRLGASEANFWQPRPAPLSQQPGTPWFFKVRGTNQVAGYGFFSYYTVVPVGTAWETFREANGSLSFDEMFRRVLSLRHGKMDGDDSVGCVVLSDVSVLPEARYLPAPVDWKPNTVRGQYYNLSDGEGRRLWHQLAASAPPPVSSAAGGFYPPRLAVQRRGQGAFRLMVMDAYDRRCAVSGERTQPVLEAAHIRPFAEEASHELTNGICLRSDIHRLFDQGYVTVTADYRFKVSARIREQFHNGVIYYDMDERPLRLPNDRRDWPDPSLLEWHSGSLFRG